MRKLVPVSKRKIEFTKPNVNSRKTSKPNQNRTPAKPSQIKKSTKEIGTNLPVNPIKPTKEPNQKTSKLKPNPRPFKPNQEEKFSKISPFSRNGRIPENKNRERKNFYLLYLHLFFLFSFDSRVCMFCFVINFSLKCLKPIFFLNKTNVLWRFRFRFYFSNNQFRFSSNANYRRKNIQYNRYNTYSKSHKAKF